MANGNAISCIKQMERPWPKMGTFKILYYSVHAKETRKVACITDITEREKEPRKKKLVRPQK